MKKNTTASDFTNAQLKRLETAYKEATFTRALETLTDNGHSDGMKFADNLRGPLLKLFRDELRKLLEKEARRMAADAASRAYIGVKDQ